MAAKSGAERRRAPRRQVLDSFSLFVVVPRKGSHRLVVHDLSEVGIGFDADIEGEGTSVPLANGDVLEVQLYLNQTLSIPVEVRLIRIEEKWGIRRVGAEFTQPSSPANTALNSFLKMLDIVGEVGQLTSDASKS